MFVYTRNARNGIYTGGGRIQVFCKFTISCVLRARRQQSCCRTKEHKTTTHTHTCTRHDKIIKLFWITLLICIKQHPPLHVDDDAGERNGQMGPHCTVRVHARATTTQIHCDVLHHARFICIYTLRYIYYAIARYKISHSVVVVIRYSVGPSSVIFIKIIRYYLKF